MTDPTLLAAVDLGSNSFRLEINRAHHGQLQRVQYLKETVRQGAGLDENRLLTPEAMERGWACLARFAQPLAGFAPQQVRAVATQTLREARNSDVFIARACEILGHPITVVSGPEEARLIYQGVSHLLAPSPERRLVIDIGGRSTELILGQGYSARQVASLRMGSVSWSQRHFPDGVFTKAAFDAAQIAAQAVIAEVLAQYPRQDWERAYGSSGTVGAVGDILTASGHSPGLITHAALRQLRQQLLQAGHSSRVDLPALKEDRRPVIGGGITLLLALFEALGIEQLQVAQGALRQGLLYDLLERQNPASDARGCSVRALQERFGVDVAQAQRVANVAGALLAQVLPEGGHGAVVAPNLDAAARLHEIGCQIAHSGYHRHGAYILTHTDAPGFTLSELQELALWVRAHRGKLRKIEMPWDAAHILIPLACLRIAVALCHGRNAPDAPNAPDMGGVGLSCQGQRLRLTLPSGWAARHPQSLYLLQEECSDWERTPWSLELVQSAQ